MASPCTITTAFRSIRAIAAICCGHASTSRPGSQRSVAPTCSISTSATSAIRSARERTPASATASSTSAGPAAQNKVRGRNTGKAWLNAHSSSGVPITVVASSTTAGRRSRAANQTVPANAAKASAGASATFSLARYSGRYIIAVMASAEIRSGFAIQLNAAPPPLACPKLIHAHQLHSNATPALATTQRSKAGLSRRSSQTIARLASATNTTIIVCE